MKNVLLMNSIADSGIQQFDYTRYHLSTDEEDPDLILVRSASLHDRAVNPSLKAIGRAGAGVNNIPIEALAEKGVVVFNTPGANANGVKELAIAALLLSARDIYDGIKWVNSLEPSPEIAKRVEKEKSRFAGIELAGKTLGVIGLGAIGGMVANTALELGMKVIGYDPFMSVEAAWRLSSSVKKASGFDEIYRKSDFISIHVPSTKDTKGMLSAAAFAQMKDGVRLINLARGDLVKTADLKEALESGRVSRYVTDFPDADTINYPGIVAIPHLGASTNESEENCARMAALQLIDYAENGNIKNSVNYPTVVLDRGSCTRIGVMHHNRPGVISGITTAVASHGFNIEHMVSGNKNDMGYMIVDFYGNAPDALLADIDAIDGVIRALVFKG